MEIIPVARMGEVIRHALVRAPEPIEWDEAKEPVPAKVSEDDAAASPTAHYAIGI
jgi:ATP-dependent Lon protease